MIQLFRANTGQDYNATTFLNKLSLLIKQLLCSFDKTLWHTKSMLGVCVEYCVFYNEYLII